ncbi:hypothetical protein D5366_06890 [Neokomagataea tanensis]|uniref:Uncharacterized protein n=1 Tax=Neokomagataea tanensis TaxID=661191 RepID=A0A4Y6V4I4_9PROT|nr:hypothetical protein D5366_06890 [Neokomagataea tanensis]
MPTLHEDISLKRNVAKGLLQGVEIADNTKAFRPPRMSVRGGGGRLIAAKSGSKSAGRCLANPNKFPLTLIRFQFSPVFGWRLRHLFEGFFEGFSPLP